MLSPKNTHMLQSEQTSFISSTAYVLHKISFAKKRLHWKKKILNTNIIYSNSSQTSTWSPEPKQSSREINILALKQDMQDFLTFYLELTLEKMYENINSKWILDFLLTGFTYCWQFTHVVYYFMAWLLPLALSFSHIYFLFIFLRKIT